jgi:hypothetical protein
MGSIAQRFWNGVGARQLHAPDEMGKKLGMGKYVVGVREYGVSALSMEE